LGGKRHAKKKKEHPREATTPNRTKTSKLASKEETGKRELPGKRDGKQEGSKIYEMRGKVKE